MVQWMVQLHSCCTPSNWNRQHDPATYRDETFIKANQLSLVQLLRECLCGGRLNCRGWGFYLTNIKRKRCCCCFRCDQTPTRTSTLNQLKATKYKNQNNDLLHSWVLGLNVSTCFPFQLHFLPKWVGVWRCILGVWRDFCATFGITWPDGYWRRLQTAPRFLAFLGCRNLVETKLLETVSRGSTYTSDTFTDLVPDKAFTRYTRSLAVVHDFADWGLLRHVQTYPTHLVSQRFPGFKPATSKNLASHTYGKYATGEMLQSVPTPGGGLHQADGADIQNGKTHLRNMPNWGTQAPFQCQKWPNEGHIGGKPHLVYLDNCILRWKPGSQRHSPGTSGTNKNPCVGCPWCTHLKMPESQT